MSESKTKEKIHGAIKQGKKFKRRDFLKTTGIAAAAIAGINTKEAFAFGKRKTKKQMGMVIDLRRCFGCHACQVACKAQFDVPLGVWRSWVIVTEKGRYPNMDRQFLPVLCNNCSNTPCLKGCPATAIVRDENGIVCQLEDECIGCGYCLQTCPYKMRFRNPKKNVANKCNFCIERLKQGLEPACVDTCNAKARIFGDLNDPESDVSKLLTENPVQVLLPEQNTHPNVYYIGLDESMYYKRAATLKTTLKREDE